MKKKRSIRKKRIARKKNPSLLYKITAKGTGPKMHFDGVKFSERAKVKLFATKESAHGFALKLVSRYPMLRRYRVAIEDNRHRVTAGK